MLRLLGWILVIVVIVVWIDDDIEVKDVTEWVERTFTPAEQVEKADESDDPW